VRVMTVLRDGRGGSIAPIGSILGELWLCGWNNWGCIDCPLWPFVVSRGPVQPSLEFLCINNRATGALGARVESRHDSSGYMQTRCLNPEQLATVPSST